MKYRCYVYKIIVDGVTRYIGKGTGDRAYGHIRLAKSINRRRRAGACVSVLRFHNKLAKALRGGATVSYRRIKLGLSSKEAFDLEVLEIAKYPKGQLWNVLPGGQGCDSEHFKRIWADPIVRAKYMKTRNSPEYRKKKKEQADIQWDDEACEVSRNRSEKQWADPVLRANIISGMRNSPNKEQKNKQISQSVRKVWSDPEYHAKMCKINKAAAAKRREREKVV